MRAFRDVNQLPVMQHGTSIGVVSRDAIVHYLEVRRILGVEHSKSDTHNQLSRVAQRATGEEGFIMRHVLWDDGTSAHDTLRHSMSKAKDEQEVRR
jgi:hypothetical protein